MKKFLKTLFRDYGIGGKIFWCIAFLIWVFGTVYMFGFQLIRAYLMANK